MSQSWQNSLTAALDTRREQHLYRTRKLLDSPQQVDIIVDGQSCINFCSNDYLGFANHPEIKQAAIDAIQHDGFGGGASHLVIGHHNQHHQVEAEIADWLGCEAALLFSTGYMANVAVLTALAGKNDRLLLDKLSHASLIDGAQLSRAKFARFKHLDMAHLRKLLADDSFERNFVVTDGVFSMDGDIAPIGELAQICEETDSVLVVDDAHGFGTIGDGGRGVIHHFGIDANKVVQIGTLGKAFGSTGAFVAGSQALIDYLVQFARPYIYTTSMPPSSAAATRAAIKLVQTNNPRREHLDELVNEFRQQASKLGYTLWPSFTAIQPIIMGSSEAALELSSFLQQRGILVSAIRPPTVPKGSARLRITFTAGHTRAHLAELIEALREFRNPQNQT